MSAVHVRFVPLASTTGAMPPHTMKAYKHRDSREERFGSEPVHCHTRLGIRPDEHEQDEEHGAKDEESQASAERRHAAIVIRVHKSLLSE
jgi:hypothetical protein